MSDHEALPHARPVEVRAVIERPSPWLPVRSILVNLVLISVGGALFWFVVDRL